MNCMNEISIQLNLKLFISLRLVTSSSIFWHVPVDKVTIYHIFIRLQQISAHNSKTHKCRLSPNNNKPKNNTPKPNEQYQNKNEQNKNKKKAKVSRETTMLTCTISALTPCSAARKGLSMNTRHGDILANLFICWTASLSCSSTRLSPMGRKKSRNQGSSQTASARRNGAHIGRSFFPLTATVQQGRDTLVISWRNNILSAFKSKFPAGTTRE